MFQDLNKKNPNDTNLKLMSISASVLIGLFVFMMIKSNHTIQGNSYYVGIGFLFILLILSFTLNRYKDKIRKKIPKNRFQQELEVANKCNSYEPKKEESFIEAVESNVMFSDIAGIESIKEELQEIVEFLHNPKVYQKYDVNLPKGVLLVGPPGVGKTLIAKAVAGEAQVPFFYQSASSFVNIYVGAGAKKVRELFMMAKAHAPSIIFIDEIDAIGKSRGLGSNDERESTLNELLTAMDGFDSNSGVMVIAATNKIEVLDEALLRAGRFDRRVFLSLPSLEDREKILKLYLKDKKYNFDITLLANSTSGFSSAALATLINEALLYMIKLKDSILEEKHIEYAKQKIQFGKYQIKLLSDDEKDILSSYQAAKAYIAQSKVTLLDGVVDEKDILYPSKKDLEDNIKVNLAGTVYLEIEKNQSYIVSEDDIKKAYSIAKNMVEEYHLESNQDELIVRLKAQLKEELQNNIEEIERLKDILLEDEVVVF